MTGARQTACPQMKLQFKSTFGLFSVVVVGYEVCQFCGMTKNQNGEKYFAMLKLCGDEDINYVSATKILLYWTKVSNIGVRQSLIF